MGKGMTVAEIQELVPTLAVTVEPVGRLQERLGIPASTLSHHLQRLIATGLVTQERQATTLICRANYPAMDSLIGFLADECCADAACASSEEAVA